MAELWRRRSLLQSNVLSRRRALITPICFLQILRLLSFIVDRIGTIAHLVIFLLLCDRRSCSSAVLLGRSSVHCCGSVVVSTFLPSLADEVCVNSSRLLSGQTGRCTGSQLSGFVGRFSLELRCEGADERRRSVSINGGFGKLRA